jgi:hypothetical protein
MWVIGSAVDGLGELAVTQDIPFGRAMVGIK